MKKITLLSILSFLLCNLEASAQNIVWDSAVVVADGSQYGYIRPRMTLNKQGQPQIVMAKSSGGKLYFTQMNGTTFSTPTLIHPSDMSTYVATWTGPDMEAHGDTVIIVFKALPYDEGSVYTVRSTDGGQTFSDTIRVESHGGAGLVWLPSMAMDGNGNPIVTYMAHGANYSNPHYVYVSSNDGGLTYNQEEVITGMIPGEACDCCPSELVADGNRHVLLFRNNDNSLRDIYAVYSNDSGQSFQNAENVDQHNWFINSCPSTGPQGLMSDSTLLVAYVSGGSGEYRVSLSKSYMNDSVVFQENIDVLPPVNPTGSQNFPRMAQDENTLVLAWAETGASSFEIFTAYAENGNLQQLTQTKQQANVLTQGVQTNPDVKIKDGVVHLVYQNSQTADVMYQRGVIGFVGEKEKQLDPNAWFPNPLAAGSNLSIPNSWLSEEWIQVTDLNGKEIQRVYPKNGSTIPGLQTGVYFLHSPNSVSAVKLIVQ